MKNIFTILILALCSSLFAQPGSNDPTFNPTDGPYGDGSGYNSSVIATCVQTDGKIIVGGGFINSFNGAEVTNISRLNSNGTLDTDFATNVGTGFNNTVNAAIRIQADDKILVGGSFTQFNGINRSYLTRIGGE
jgi:hypothetical protein